jgi:primary-amine oxidase
VSIKLNDEDRGTVLTRATMVQLIPYLVLASTVLALPPLGYERKLFHEKLARSSYNTSESCLTDAAPTTKAPKSNIWAQIAAEDNLAVWNLLHDPASGLNLTHPSKAVPSDNYV